MNSRAGLGLYPPPHDRCSDVRVVVAVVLRVEYVCTSGDHANRQSAANPRDSESPVVTSVADLVAPWKRNHDRQNEDTQTNP